MEIPNADLNEWVSELKTYQTNTITELLSDNNSEETIKLWLSANGPTSTIPFGGDNESSEPFLERFKEEFKKFVCGDEAYEEYRNKLTAEVPIAKSVYISVISVALAQVIGFTAALLAPAVAILLHAVGAAGVHAWCNAN